MLSGYISLLPFFSSQLPTQNSQLLDICWISLSKYDDYVQLFNLSKDYQLFCNSTTISDLNGSIPESQELKNVLIMMLEEEKEPIYEKLCMKKDWRYEVECSISEESRVTVLYLPEVRDDKIEKLTRSLLEVWKQLDWFEENMTPNISLEELKRMLLESETIKTGVQRFLAN